MKSGISFDAQTGCTPGNVGKFLMGNRRLNDLRVTRVLEIEEEMRLIELIIPSVIAHADGRNEVVMLELGANWAYYSMLQSPLKFSVGCAQRDA